MQSTSPAPAGAPRPRVLLIFGGRSSEHGISCATAAGFLSTIDRERWDVLPVGITGEGEWVPVPDDPARFALTPHGPQHVEAGASRVVLGPAGSVLELTWDRDPAEEGARLVSTVDRGRVDVALPLLHGAYGEDGTIQGMLEMAGVRYVGCGVTSSAICMDKHLTKTVLASAGVDVGTWELITPREWEGERAECERRVAALGYPVFVKPCRAGSSIGISRVDSPEGLEAAVTEAMAHDPRVIVEGGLVGREVECGVIARSSYARPETAPLGEIVLPEGQFYDYESKYLSTDAIGLVCPADLDEALSERIRSVAARSFEVLECEGLARVDFFVDVASGRVVVNEVNTMPGFTPFSMFSQVWAQGGLAYRDLIDVLLDEALARPLGLR